MPLARFVPRWLLPLLQGAYGVGFIVEARDLGILREKNLNQALFDNEICCTRSFTLLEKNIFAVIFIAKKVVIQLCFHIKSGGLGSGCWEAVKCFGSGFRVSCVGCREYLGVDESGAFQKHSGCLDWSIVA